MMMLSGVRSSCDIVATKSDLSRLAAVRSRMSTAFWCAMAVACAIFETIEKEGLLLHARALGEHAKRRFASELPDCQVRGEGLFLGLELPEAPKSDLTGAALEAGLVINVTQQKVVRLAPGLVITAEQWDEGLDKLIGLIRA